MGFRVWYVDYYWSKDEHILQMKDGLLMVRKLIDNWFINNTITIFIDNQRAQNGT